MCQNPKIICTDLLRPPPPSASRALTPKPPKLPKPPNNFGGLCLPVCPPGVWCTGFASAWTEKGSHRTLSKPVGQSIQLRKVQCFFRERQLNMKESRVTICGMTQAGPRVMTPENSKQHSVMCQNNQPLSSFEWSAMDGSNGFSWFVGVT